MSQNLYPRPFNESYVQPSDQERWDARDLFDAALEDVFLAHATEMVTRTKEASGQTFVLSEVDYTVNLVSDESVKVGVRMIDSTMFRSGIVHMLWQTRKTRRFGAIYNTDVESGDVLRRDITIDSVVLAGKRVEEILGKPLGEASREEADAAFHQAGIENKPANTFAKECGLNNLPVYPDEVRWLAGIVLSSL